MGGLNENETSSFKEILDSKSGSCLFEISLEDESNSNWVGSYLYWNYGVTFPKKISLLGLFMWYD